MEYGKKHRKTISWQVAQEILVIICNYCRVSIFVVDEASKSACGACVLRQASILLCIGVFVLGLPDLKQGEAERPQEASKLLSPHFRVASLGDLMRISVLVTQHAFDVI